MKLENKVAIITGGSLGIGKATAILFADVLDSSINQNWTSANRGCINTKLPI